MKKLVFKSVGVLSILLFCLTGCSSLEKPNINDKLDSELEYVEDLIFKIANKHAKGEYVEDEKINWDYIKGDIQKLNDSWNTLILDLTEVNTPNEDIIGYSTNLNQLLISVSKKDEAQMISRLDAMYEKIIKFNEASSESRNQIEKNKIKYEVLAIYNLAVNNDFEAAKVRVIGIIEKYMSLMNDENYAEENRYNLSKIYILLEEYKNAVESQNIDLVRMKYITTVETL